MESLTLSACSATRGKNQYGDIMNVCSVRLRSVCGRARIGYTGGMHIDDDELMIRRLPLAKRKELDEMVRSLEESAPAATPATMAEPAAPRVALRPVRGLLRDLGPVPSDDAIDEARRELWAGFPHEDLP
jgi:hypothetical protein